MAEHAQNFLTSRTGRLALTYLAIIMALTMFFSVVIYAIVATQLDRPPSPSRDAVLRMENEFARDQFEQLVQERTTEAKESLVLTLALLNASMLVVGALISYVLARRTLQPIEHAMAAQSQFVSDASHELRTPLTALQATNEVALRKKSLSLGDAKTLIAANVDEAVKLRNLTNALLSLVKEEHQPARYEAVHLSEVVGDAIQSIVPIAQEKNIQVDDQVPNLSVVTDRHALAQVLKIFVENAIKYSPDNARVTVTAKATGDDVALHVTDTGPGIAEKDLPHIFQRFYRTDASRSTQHVEGYGLGLAIAKTICDRQKWDIRVASQLGHGSTFSVVMKQARVRKNGDATD